MNKTSAIVLLAAACSFLNGSETSWVADPYRSAAVSWKKHPVLGRDFWLLLNPAWLTLDGVKNEPFIRESGTSHIQTALDRQDSVMRTLFLREIRLYSGSGKAVKGKAAVSSGEKNVVVQQIGNLFDGNLQTRCVISAPILDIKKRYTSFRAMLRIDAADTFRSVQIFHGTSSGGGIRSVSGPGLSAAEIQKGKDRITIRLAGPVRTLTLILGSELPVYSVQRLRIYPQARERLKKYPFYVEPPFRFALGSLLGLRKENIDRESFEKISRDYPESFLGFRLAEWDSNFLQTLIRPGSDRFKDLSAFIRVPCTKEGLLKNFHTFWQIHTELLGSRVFGLSGQINFMHMGCDFGGRIAGVELTQEQKEHPHRNTLMYTRGASRQFGVPMMVYTAYYAVNYAPDSRIKRKNSVFGLDYGMPPSLGLRNFYISYYMGNNFLDFESQPYGQAVKNDRGVYELTANGKAIREIFEWTRKPEGRRGECYTPFLLLADRKHGNDMWYRLFDYWGTWYSLYPAEDPHYMTEYFMQAVSPRYDVRSFDDPYSSGNLRNSSLGDLFDLYVANPLLKKSVSLRQLEKYAAVFLIDDLALSEELVHTLKEYTARGGTLILSTGQAEHFAADKDFLPVKISSGTVVRDQLKIHQLTPDRKRCKVLMTTTDGLPLAVRSSYGSGYVILSASPFWRTTANRLRVPPQLRTMLEKIQEDVLPLKVRGDGEFLINIMPDNTWKVILVNNRGIVKRPGESKETFHTKFTSQITLSLPSGTKVREVRKNAVPAVRYGKGCVEYTFTLPPGEILVVDCAPIRDLPRLRPAEKVKVQKLPFPAEKTRKKLPFDGYRERHIPRKGIAAPADPLIGSWRGADKGRDSSGNGNHLKLWAVDTKDNAFVMKGDRSCASVRIRIPWELPEGTWEIWVNPAEPDKFPLHNGQRHAAVLYTKQMSIVYHNGYWQLVLLDRNRRQIRQGSKALPGWTHLAVTYKDGFCRFYVGGREVISAEGPLKYAAVPGKNSFYNLLDLTVGAYAPHQARMSPFRGRIGDIRCYNKALSASEIRSKAAEVPFSKAIEK